MRKNILIVLFAIALVAEFPSAIAETEPKQLHFVITKFEILGENPLTESETQNVFECYLGDHYGLEGIQEAAKS